MANVTANMTSVTANTTLHHNVANSDPSQMMLLFAIAIAAGLFAYAISVCVSKLHDRSLKKQEIKKFGFRFKKGKFTEEFLIENNTAAVFINGAEGEKNIEKPDDTPLYTRAFGFTDVGVFEIAVEAMIQADRCRNEKETQQRGNGDVVHTPVQDFDNSK